jgi:excisionase family DNA binding protein
MQEVLTLQEAAEFLRCSPDTVKRKARAGDLPASKIGRVWRFRRADLDEWLANGGTRREELEDEGLLAAIEEAKREVAEGREQLVPWEEAKKRLGL